MLEVWQYSKVSSIGYESYYETMAIQRLENKFDWSDISIIK